MAATVRQQVRVFAIATLVACTSCASSQTIRPFTTDGCSSFPDGTLSQRELWKHCCLEHDKAYWRGGTRDERRDADRQLGQCVAEAKDAALGFLMSKGVRVGGSPWWPTRFRWAYGWPYGRGYRQLSEAEQRAADEVLAADEASNLPVGCVPDPVEIGDTYRAAD